MKKLLCLFCFFLSLQIWASSAKIQVSGMVCQACVGTLTKTFKQDNAVKKVDVKLETQTISLRFQKDKELTDQKLKKMITSAGYKVTKITRLP